MTTRTWAASARQVARAVILSAAGAALLAGAPLAWATNAKMSYSWLEQAGSPQQITAVSSNGVAGILGGARAVAFFDDGSTSTSLFTVSTTSLTQFAVATVAGRFNLVATSDGSLVSFPSLFVTNLSSSLHLVGFSIDGRGDGAGQAAFDRGLGSFGGPPSTPGSNTGRDLTVEFADFLVGTVTVTYSQPIGLLGAAPIGDLFRSVDVRMAVSSLGGGLPPTSQFSGAFSRQDVIADIDAVSYAAAVPEPSHAALMLAGLGVVASLRRRR